MVIHSGRECIGIQWVKVTLYFHQREKIAKRLHHGLSETIIVNTVTEVREFKNAYADDVAAITDIQSWVKPSRLSPRPKMSLYFPA